MPQIAIWKSRVGLRSADSGRPVKSVQFQTGITVQFAPESVSSLGWNACPVWIGIDDQFGPEYAGDANLRFSFANMGIWRKIYIIFNWTISLLFLAAIAVPAMEDDTNRFGIIILIATIYLGLAAWVHSAVVGRKTGQLLALIILQLVSLNLLGALIVLAIRSTSKREIRSWYQGATG